ncbi:MAG: ABC transporter permease [Candidatus Bipolaricaulota bacterium]
MKGVLRLAWLNLRTWLRERITLFWTLLFPVFLLVLLGAIFGGTNEESYMRFHIGLVNLDREVETTDFGEMVEDAFAELATRREEGREQLFVLRRPAEDEDPEGFLSAEREALRQGQRAAIVIIPRGFSETVARAVREPSPSLQAQIQVLYSQGDASSELAGSIVEQVLTGLDRELLIQAGLYNPDEEIPVASSWVGTADRAARYVDFLLPGVILMAFLTNGLFGVPGSILYARDHRILRRYWVTPLTVRRYLIGFSLSTLGMCALQLGLLWALGRWAFGAQVQLAAPGAGTYLLLSAVTFLALGFLIASLAKTANAAMSIANILNMPLLFLSGIFFPVTVLPLALQVLVYANPVTYLVDGLRASLGVGAGQLPPWATLVVPVLWILFAGAMAERRLQWDVDR